MRSWNQTCLLLSSLLAALLVACSTAQVAPTQSAEAAAQYLLHATAEDFRSQRPNDPVTFRSVRFGYTQAADGAKQYLLCGEFLSAQPGAEWVRFTTLKTSEFEVLLGGQSASFCGPAAHLEEDNLSSTLQHQTEAVR